MSTTKSAVLSHFFSHTCTFVENIEKIHEFADCVQTLSSIAGSVAYTEKHATKFERF